MASRKYRQKQNAIVFFTKSYQKAKRLGRVFEKKATDSNKASESSEVAEPTQLDLATPYQDDSLVIATSPQINTSKQQNSDCWLLQLPAELRNAIWELTCTASTSKDGEIELLRTALPSASLLFSCRQIHHEAVAIYHQARSDMFEKGRFCLDATRYTITASTIKMISRDHLATECRSIDNEHRRIDTLWQDGLWHRTETSLNSSMQWFTVVTTGRYSNSETFQDRDAARDYLAQTASRPSVENQIAYFLAVDQKW